MGCDCLVIIAVYCRFRQIAPLYKELISFPSKLLKMFRSLSLTFMC
jgi:hypothetical protein